MAVPHRSFKTTNEELARVLAQHCVPLRDENGQLLPGVNGMSPVEAMALLAEQGKVEGLTQGEKDTLARARAAQRADASEETDDDEGMELLPADPDPTIVVDPTQPILPPRPEEDLPMSVPGAGGPKISKVDFRALMQKHLKAILDEGRDRTQAADVHRMRPETGYSREQVRKELVRLCSGPHTDADVYRLRRDESDQLGVYELYVAELAHAV